MRPRNKVWFTRLTLLAICEALIMNDAVAYICTSVLQLFRSPNGNLFWFYVYYYKYPIGTGKVDLQFIIIITSTSNL